MFQIKRTKEKGNKTFNPTGYTRLLMRNIAISHSDACDFLNCDIWGEASCHGDQFGVEVTAITPTGTKIDIADLLSIRDVEEIQLWVLENINEKDFV